MSTIYIPANDQSAALAGASTSFMQWMLQLQHSQREERELQQSLETGKLRQKALQIQNQQMEEQGQEWRDTKDLHRQHLQQENQLDTSKLRTESLQQEGLGSQNELMKLQLARFPILAASEDEKHKAAMQEFDSRMKDLGLDIETKKKRMMGELPETKAQIDQLQAATAESTARTEQLKVGIKQAAAQDAWKSSFDAVKMSYELRNDPGAYEALRAQAPNPEMALALKLIPPGLKGPDDGIKALQTGLINLASSSKPGAAQAEDMVTLMGLKEFAPEQLLNSVQVDNMGNKILVPNVDTIKKAQEGFHAFFQSKRDANTYGPPKSLMEGATTAQPTNTDDGIKIDEKGLPPELLSDWAHLKRYPREAKMTFLQGAKLEDKGWQHFYDEMPKEQGSNDMMLPPSYLEGTGWMAKLGTKKPFDFGKLNPFGGRFGKQEGRLNYDSEQGFTVVDDLLKRPEDKSVFKNLIQYDPKATGEQHVMYMSLMRQLANARNEANDTRAKSMLKKFYTATGPNFLTKLQKDSLGELEKTYGW